MGGLMNMADPPDISTIGTLFGLLVASAANPTELNAVGTTTGDLRCVFDAQVGNDSTTWYRLDTSTASVNAPYTMASLTAGKRWVAFAGTYSALPANFASTVACTQLTSSIATGTPPLVVASTTNVPNLNASSLSGATFAAPGAIGGGTPSTGAFTTISASGVITSTLATGTAPFTVASTTVVGNLNVSQLLGGTWAIPGSIGATTPAAGAFTTLGASGLISAATLTASGLITASGGISGVIGATGPTTGAFTTISASGVITSTLATGTAPFTVASTTVVGNLNVSQLLGGTWAIPGAIGATTPNTGSFTTVSASGNITCTVNGATIRATSASGNGNLSVDGSTQSNVNFYVAGALKGQLTTTSSAFWNFFDNVNSNTVLAYTPSTLATCLWNFSGTLDAGSTTSASVVLAGGLGVAKAARIGSTTAASSSITGGLIIGDGATAATNVGIGGGQIRAGAAITALNYATNGTAIAAGTYHFDVLAAAGAARDILRAGESAFSNGLTVQYNGTRMVYVFDDATSTCTWNSTVDATAIGTAAGVFAGGLSVAKSLGLAPIAAPGSPFMGQIWNDSTRQGLMTFAGSSTSNGVKQCLPGVLFTATATATAAGTVAATSIFGTGVGSKTLPANFLTVGKSIRVSLRGFLSNGSGGTLTVLLKLGSVTVSTTNAVTPTGTMTTAYFEFECTVLCTAVGGSGVVTGAGRLTYANGQTAQILSAIQTGNVVDTTASAAIDITAQWSVASASNSIGGYVGTIEVLN